MGQKVNPHGLRVGVIKDWDSQWFVDKKDFAANIKEDNEIRKVLKKKYYQAAISKIAIEKAATKITITIFTARPGVLIGKQGSEIEIIKNHTPIKAIRLSKFTNKDDFSVPTDNYHFMCNSYYNNPDIYEHILEFSKNTLDKSIFIIVGHSYEFEVLNEWDKIENLIKYIKTFDSFEVVTFKDAIKKLRG